MGTNDKMKVIDRIVEYFLKQGISIVISMIFIGILLVRLEQAEKATNEAKILAVEELKKCQASREELMNVYIDLKQALYAFSLEQKNTNNTILSFSNELHQLSLSDKRR